MLMDTQARIDGNGYLSLGNGGYSDNQADATNKYALADCRLDLFNGDVLHRPTGNALPTTNLTEARVRSSAGLWTRTYTVAGGAADSFILIQIPHLIRTGAASASLTNPPGQAVAFKGFKLTSIDLNYIIATADGTAINVAAQAETAQTNNVARALVASTGGTAPLGTVTYQNPIGTVVASAPVAQQAAPYQVRAVFGTPVFMPTNTLTVEIELSLQQNCVLTLTGLWANFSSAIY